MTSPDPRALLERAAFAHGLSKAALIGLVYDLASALAAALKALQRERV